MKERVEGPAIWGTFPLPEIDKGIFVSSLNIEQTVSVRIVRDGRPERQG